MSSKGASTWPKSETHVFKSPSARRQNSTDHASPRPSPNPSPPPLPTPPPLPKSEPEPYEPFPSREERFAALYREPEKRTRPRHRFIRPCLCADGDPAGCTQPASSSSKVHTHETTARGTTADPWDDPDLPSIEAPSSAYQQFRHSGWKPLRKRTLEALRIAGKSSKQLARFTDCGSLCHIWESKSLDKRTIRGNFCKSRECAPCAIARSRLIQSNLVPFVQERNVRFLTLTLKHRDRPLSTQITRLWRCFKTLRTTPEFKSNVLGFCAFLEVKRNPKTHLWHVHLHILLEGQWWDQKEISRLWLEATGDSMIVDIQNRGTPQQMAHYGAKYASKPINSGDMETPAVHAEAILGVGRRRLWLIGGAWKGHLKLLARGEDATDWVLIDSANALFARAANGDLEAIAVIESLISPTKHKPNIDSS